MSTSPHFKRRQILLLGGTGAIGFLSGGAVAAGIINADNITQVVRPSQSAQMTPTSLVQTTKVVSEEPYLNPGTFNQQFLAKSADIKQVWDFATIEQVQSDGGFAPIKNALNAFQFVYLFDLSPWLHLPEATCLQLQWGFVPEHPIPPGDPRYPKHL